MAGTEKDGQQWAIFPAQARYPHFLYSAETGEERECRRDERGGRHLEEVSPREGAA